MTSERWRRIEAVFDRASELAVDERADYVTAECGEDDALRSEVLDLLAGVETGDSLLRGIISTTVTSLSDPARRIGARIGAYRIAGVLGEGGMGTVFLAERDDAQFSQRVAIKVLRHELVSPSVVARFRDERQILATLDHPGIVKLLDGGNTESELPYLVMEYVEGTPFVDHVETLDIRRRIELVRRVAEAVQYAHQRLIVHRDLKPSNLLVDRRGTPKLLDFGIAKLLDTTAQRNAETRTGFAQLTPEYASPEQVRGEQISVATDVYSLGAVLYHVLVGRPPQRAGTTTLDTLHAICEVDPPRPSTVAPTSRRELAGDLDSIVLKALHKRPESRYASMSALIEDLDRHLQGLPIMARDATPAYRAAKFIRRHTGKLALAGVFVTIVAFAVMFSLRQATRADAHARDAERQNIALLAERGRSELADGLPARALPYLLEVMAVGEDTAGLRVMLAEATRPYDRAIGEVKVPEGITGVVPQAGGFVVTSHGTTIGSYDAHGRVRATHAVSAALPAAAVAPDGTVVSATPRGELQIWKPSTNQAVLVPTHTAAVVKFAAAEGRAISAGHDGMVAITDLGSQKRLATIEIGAPGSISAFAVQGRTAVIGRSDGVVELLDLETHARSVLDRGSNRIVQVARTRDGRVIAADQHAIRIWGPAGDLRTTIAAHGVPVHSIELAGDEQRLLSFGGSTARIWDLGSGALIAELLHDIGLMNAHFSPDGRHVVTTARNNYYRVWDAATGFQLFALVADPGGGSRGLGHAVDAGFLDGGTLWTAEGAAVKLWHFDGSPLIAELSAPPGRPLTAVFSPDDRLIAIGGDSFLELWDARRNQRLHAFEGVPKIWDVSFSRDGSRLLVASEDTTVRIFDHQRELHRLVGHRKTVNRSVFSPDGSRIATVSGDGTARIWDANGRELVKLEHPSSVMSVHWRFDGARFVTSGWDGKLRVWDAATYEPLLVIDASPVQFLDVAFSPDGDQLAATGHSGEVSIWDASTGTQVRSLVGHTGPVTTAAWSHDGMLIATAADDATARLWDAATGMELAVRRHPHHEVMQVSWSHDGARLITANTDGKTRIWDARREHRSLPALQELQQRHVPYHLVDGRLVVLER